MAHFFKMLILITFIKEYLNNAFHELNGETIDIPHSFWTTFKCNPPMLQLNNIHLISVWGKPSIVDESLTCASPLIKART